jgi:methylthioribose-1-phosphate isomerase
MANVPHPAPLSGDSYSAAELALDDSEVILLDQRRLPLDEIYYRLSTVEQVEKAIAVMVVRGAPAIGIAAAYGMVLAAGRAERHGLVELERAAFLLKRARPTAVNLAWAVDRMLGCAHGLALSELRSALAAEARAIHREDVLACRRMGQLGAAHVPEGATVLTHCNAGALATGGYGTALGVIRAAHEAGKRVQVLADETRPYLQGARLTAWELQRSGIPVTVVCDNNAGHLYASGRVQLTVVGADRIANNGDFANKIGTYTLACLSRTHELPFYVAAPWSTVDRRAPDGAAIPIEQRPAHEVTELKLGDTHGPGEAGGSVHRLVPAGVDALNPAFDVTPARLVTALFTERGIASPLHGENLRALGGDAATPKAGE